MNKHLPAQVIGIASGKGGVGKTTVSVNLAVALAATGKRVMLFDADLSLANAQIALGCRAPYNMSHFLSGEKRLDEIVVTSRQGVKLVPGASGLQEMAALNELQMARIVQEFSTLEDQIDYLIVDMAAGISPMVMTLLSACSRRFVVVQDDPSSIADAYGTIKVMLQDHQLDEIYLIPNAVQSETEGQQLFDRINRVCARFNFLSRGWRAPPPDDHGQPTHVRRSPREQQRSAGDGSPWDGQTRGVAFEGQVAAFHGA